jgi:MFS family permease
MGVVPSPVSRSAIPPRAPARRDIYTPWSAAAVRLVVALTLAAITVSILTTIAMPLIPMVAREQGVPLESAQWMLTVTLVVAVVATPIAGRLGDGPRRDRILAATLAVSLAGCVLAATATGFAQLLVGRGLQGVGYAAVPLAVAIAREHLAESQVRTTVATLSVTVAVGAGLGFPTSGLIAQVLGLQAVFWFAAVVSAGALAAVLIIVPRSARSARRVKLDPLGALLLGAGLGSFVLAVSRATLWGWTSAEVLITGGAGLVLLGLWVVSQLRIDEPLVDLRLMRRPSVFGANVAAVFMSMAMFGSLSLLNRFVQTPASSGYGFGATVLTAGLLLLPLAAGSLAAQPLVRIVTRNHGHRVPLSLGAALVSATLITLSLGPHELWEVAAATALLGLGVGATFVTMPALIVGHVPHDRTSSAMSLNQILRSAGGSIGSALSITILAAHIQAGSGLPSEQGYTLAFLLGAAACGAAALTAILVIPGPPVEANPAEATRVIA